MFFLLNPQIVLKTKFDFKLYSTPDNNDELTTDYKYNVVRSKLKKCQFLFLFLINV